jgi:hypothetical protein
MERVIDRTVKKEKTELRNECCQVNKDSFEPCQNTPPNSFLIKLYKRFKMHQNDTIIEDETAAKEHTR